MTGEVFLEIVNKRKQELSGVLVLNGQLLTDDDVAALRRALDYDEAVARLLVELDMDRDITTIPTYDAMRNLEDSIDAYLAGYVAGEEPIIQSL